MPTFVYPIGRSHGWEKLVHPDGQLYFRNQSLHEDFAFITDINILDHLNRRLITGAALYLKRRLEGLTSNKDEAATYVTANRKQPEGGATHGHETEEVSHHAVLGKCDVFVSMVFNSEELKFEHYIVNRSRNPAGLFRICDDGVEIIDYPYVQSVSHLCESISLIFEEF